MAWQELQFSLKASEAQHVEAALEMTDALSVTLEDAADTALLEPPPGQQPLWPDCRVRALFDAHRDMAQLQATLIAILGTDTLHDARVVRIRDEQWETKWKDDFHPMQFGDNLWVCPTDSDAAPADATVVRLDPGLAFGTGTHPTTKLCLQWLAQQPLTDCTVVDYGCGSGILAIAAAKLGASRVIAIDNDAQAITATRENAIVNGVDRRITALTPECDDNTVCDCLVANILARPLTELASGLSARIKPSGSIALSGILETQLHSVQSCYRQWFDWHEPTLQDGWALLAGRRQPPLSPC